MMTTLFPLRLRLRGPRTCATAAVIVVTALTSSASPWENMSTGLFNEAHAEFTKLEKAPGADLRSLRYGDAVSLLNIQPRTQSNIEKAYQIFEELHAAAPADDLGLESRYMQGRIEHAQRATPDLQKAEAIFSELVKSHPNHPASQRAQVKLAIIRLYAKIDATERRSRYDGFTVAASQLQDAGAKVQMHLLLADVARRFDYGEAEQLNHMLAAEKAGVTKRRLRGDVLVRIGDLARLTGKNDLAATYYTQFLAEFPRTDRRTTVENYLAAFNASKK